MAHPLGKFWFGSRLVPLVAAVVASGAVSAPAEPGSHFYPCAKAPSFVRYFVGATYAGLRPDTDYVCGRPFPGEGIRENKVIYFYGSDSCPGGCTAEIEVATHPACDRNLSDYTLDPEGRRPKYTLRRIRGVPAATFVNSDFPRLELYTSDVTVVLFGSSLEAIRRAARRLRSIGGSHKVGPGDRLPPPLRGHLTGKLDCGLPLSDLRLDAPVCPAANKTCEIRIRFGLPRRAFVEARVERRTPEGFFRPVTVTHFNAFAGQTDHPLLLERGRYRVTVRGMDRVGRRTPATLAMISVD